MLFSYLNHATVEPRIGGRRHGALNAPVLGWVIDKRKSIGVRRSPGVDAAGRERPRNSAGNPPPPAAQSLSPFQAQRFAADSYICAQNKDRKSGKSLALPFRGRGEDIAGVDGAVLGDVDAQFAEEGIRDGGRRRREVVDGVFEQVGGGRGAEPVTGAFVYKEIQKFCCFFENLAINYFMFMAFYFADKFMDEQQILGHLSTKKGQQISLIDFNSRL